VSQITQSTIILGCCALLLAGCGWSDVGSAKPTSGRSPTIAEVPEADETVRGTDDPPIVTLELGSRLKERRLTRNEDLPANIIVPSTNLNAVPVGTALQAVLTGTDVSLSWDNGVLSERLVSVSNLSGPLPRVVEKICASARLFCNYRNGLLELKETETFVIELPAVATGSTGSAAANTMAETIGKLAGKDIQTDTQGGNLIYTTDVGGHEKVSEYIEQLRNGRPLVVMQMYIWEVTLDKRNAVGINWRSFKFPDLGGARQSLQLGNAMSGAANIATAFTSLTNPGVSLGAKLAGYVDADSVLQFLSTQGQVQTISNPQLTFASGSSAEFRVGGKQNYVSQVGLANSNVSGTTSNNSSTNTVSTDSVETGLTINVNGAYEGGVVVANLELTLQNLLGFDTVQTGGTNGTTIQLPRTTDRKVSTIIRVRPGDNLVMAGLVSSRDENKREGVPLPFGQRAPTFGDDTLQNSELVVLVKPSVVLFSDRQITEDEERSAVSRKRATMNSLPDALVIDKDGAQPLKQAPATPPVYISPDARHSAQPVPDIATAQSTANIAAIDAQPLAVDGVPVSRNLMQRGLSHAMDDLMVGSGGKR